MIIKNKSINSTLYIALNGELDEHAANFTRNELEKIIDNSKAIKVIFELSELQFMDSTGVGVLLGRYKKLKQNGINAFIACPTKQVDKLLALSGIYDIMPKIEY